MRCLVTGGAGFIGSHLVERLLKDGHQVDVVDNLSTGSIGNLDIHNLDLSFKEDDICKFRVPFWNLEEADWIFHLAALASIVPSIEKPLQYFDTNVEGTLNILEAARRSDVKRFIYASSYSVYGAHPKIPTKETYKCKPAYPYALTKYLGEQLVLHWNKVYKLPTVSLRLANVYGPRMGSTGSYGGVFKAFMPQLLHDKPFTRVGDGTQERDFIFVTDVVDAFIKAAESNIDGKVINIGGGRTQSINKLIYLLRDMDGGVEELKKRPGEPRITLADISKAEKLLDWTPKVRFEEGVGIMKGCLDEWRGSKVWTKKMIEGATKEWFKYLG